MPPCLSLHIHMLPMSKPRHNISIVRQAFLQYSSSGYIGVHALSNRTADRDRAARESKWEESCRIVEIITGIPSSTYHPPTFRGALSCHRPRHMSLYAINPPFRILEYSGLKPKHVESIRDAKTIEGHQRLSEDKRSGAIWIGNLE